jgi:hypothetical protein
MCFKKVASSVYADWIVLPREVSTRTIRIIFALRKRSGNEVFKRLLSPQILSCSRCDLGFKVIEAYDANRNVHQNMRSLGMRLEMVRVYFVRIPWPILTYLYTRCVHSEFFCIAPKGTVRSAHFNATAIDLATVAKKEIFTPSSSLWHAAVVSNKRNTAVPIDVIIVCDYWNGLTVKIWHSVLYVILLS